MKINILAILIVAASIFGAVGYYYSLQKGRSAAPAVIGSKVLPNLPINQAAKIVITSKDGVTTIAKSNEKWLVASRFNYPANFDKVADVIRELGELKIGQTVNVNPSQLGSFNLVSPVSSGTNKQTNSGVLLELRDKNDGFLASLLIGKSFMRKPSSPSMENMMGFGQYSSGQYIQAVDGKVYLVAKSLARMMEPAKTWLADDFINVPSTDIKEIKISGPNREEIKLTREKASGPFILADLRLEEGTLESSKVNQTTGALKQLGIDDVVDPAVSLKETGLDHPVVLKATTKDGVIYTLQVGNTLSNDTFDRYLKISVTNEPVLDQQATDRQKTESTGNKDEKVVERKNSSERAAELNSTFGQWIYVIKSYRSEPILFTRNDLIKKQESPKAEVNTINAPQTKAEEKTDVPAKTGKKTKSKDNNF